MLVANIYRFSHIYTIYLEFSLSHRLEKWKFVRVVFLI